MKTKFNIIAVLTLLSISLLCSVSCKEKPTPPIVTTAVVSGITQTTATSGGEVTDDGGASVSARGVCWNTSSNPTVSNSRTTDGSGTGTFTSTLSQLSPGTPFFLRAYATNSEGTAYGNQVTFTTSSIAPATVTTTLVSVAGNTAVVAGNISSDGGGPITARGICWGTAANPTVAGNNTTEGTGTGTFSSTITGLSCGLTYYARAYATNSAGVAYGNEESFTTQGEKPTASVESVTPYSGTEAYLYGVVNPKWAVTTVTFEYGLTNSYGQTVTASESPLPAGDLDYGVNASLTGLEPGETYHVRIKAVNSLGTTYSSNYTFISLGDKPTASVESVTPYSGTEAYLYGVVNPKWAATTVTFEYGLTNSYGQTVTASESPLPAGDLDYGVNASISGLEPGRTYHARIKAVNSLGTTYSADYTFTSLGDKPTASVGSVTPYSGTEAYLYGVVNPKWAATTVTFEYGLTNSYGQTVTASESPLPAGDLDYGVNASISGLEPGKTYHVRIKAVNSLGTTYSADYTFTSLGDKPTASVGSVTPYSGTEAYLYGVVNPKWAATTVTFEYGLTNSYGQTVTASESPLPAGDLDYGVNALISGLEPGKTYHLRIKAVNSLGTTYSSDYSFMTP